jgi:glutathione S-transferase
MKLYGHPMSTCTRKVLVTLAETATPYELVTLDFAIGEHKQEPHLARQPFGKMPAIDDDGFALYESRAICRYLAEKAGALVPRDSRDRARMEQWISVEQSYASSPMMKFVFKYVFQRPQEAAVLEAAQAEIEHVVSVLDKNLATRPYLAGEDFSVADICYLPYVEYTMLSPLKEVYARFPHFSTWWTRVSERPSWRKTAGR